MLRAVLASSIALLLSISAPAFAASGYVHDLNGKVTVTSKAGASKPLHIGDLVDNGDTIRTDAGAGATVKFEDGQVMVLREKSAFGIADYSYDKKNVSASRAVFNLISGGLRFITGVIGATNHDSFKLMAGNVTIGIRGSDVFAERAGALVSAAVKDGGAWLSSPQGVKDIGTNTFLSSNGNSGTFSQAPAGFQNAITSAFAKDVPKSDPTVLLAASKAVIDADKQKKAEQAEQEAKKKVDAETDATKKKAAQDVLDKAEKDLAAAKIAAQASLDAAIKAAETALKAAGDGGGVTGGASGSGSGSGSGAGSGAGSGTTGAGSTGSGGGGGQSNASPSTSTP